MSDSEQDDEAAVFFVNDESYTRLEKTLKDEIVLVEVENARTGETYEGIKLRSGKKEVVFACFRRTRLN